MNKPKRTIIETSQYRKDYKKVLKQGKDTILLNKIINMHANDEPLPKKYRDHQMKGQESKYRELHIQKDWMLVYQKTENGELLLILQRLGSHSEFRY